MTKLNRVFGYIIGWVTYSAIFTVALVIQGTVIPFINSGIEIEIDPLVSVIGNTFIKSLSLLLIGFVIFGFISITFRSSTENKKSGKSKVIMIGLLYFFTTAGILVTHLCAYKSLDSMHIIDASMMNAVTIIVFSVIPYFNRTVLK